MPWPWRARRDRGADLEREIRDHLDLEVEEHEQAGLPPDAARRVARLAFGNPQLVREDTREAWGGGGLERLAGDIRYALRLWARSPGFTIVALLTIALGVGAAAALFGQVNAVFWKTLPVARPAELRLLAWTAARHPFVLGPNVLDGPGVAGRETFGSFSYPAYTSMRDGTRTFSSLACWSDLGEARPVVVDEQGFAALQFVSGNYFETLGVPAAIGRTLQPHDDRPGAPAAAMISHRYWQRAFGAASPVTQRTLRLNGETFAIVGVMPQGFFGLDPSVSPDVVVPVAAVRIAAAMANPLEHAGLWNVCRIVGRVREGVGDEEARADLEAWVQQAIAAAPPDGPYDPPRVWLIDGSRGLSALRDAASAPLAVLLAVVGGLLLAACANIAGLLLTRGRTRGREIATRLALGAPATRIVRQLLTESLVLSVAGGLLGLAVAYALAGTGPALLSQFVPTLFGADRSLAISAAPDLRVLAFAVSLAVLAGLLFGVMPALHASRVDLVAMLKETVSEPRSHRFGITGGQAMVAAQTALAVLLLVAAGLFLKTVANLRNADLGFDPRGVLYARVEPRTGGMAQTERRQFFEDAVKRLDGIPGATAASAASFAAFGGSSDAIITSAQAWHGCTPESIARNLPLRSTAFNLVLPGFFATMGLRLVSGRDFTWADNVPSGQRPVIVNEAFVRAFFGNAEPIGQAVAFGPHCQAPQPRFFTVVGVATDSRASLRGAFEPTIYAPLGEFSGPVTLMVRTSGDPALMISTVRRAVAELNARIPTFSEATLVDLRERHLRRERLLSDLLLVFASATLAVCCLGIYGMLSYSVTRRRSEIAVRIAIGARAPDVVRMIVRESVVPVGAGVVLGCAAAAALTRWLGTILYGLSGPDPWTIAAAAAVFLAVAGAAAAIPARSAARVNPLLALRAK